MAPPVDRGDDAAICRRIAAVNSGQWVVDSGQFRSLHCPLSTTHCPLFQEESTMRISRVYTKSGDAGETSLVDGSRVSKADPRVVAYGDVDELNSLLGAARVGLADPQLDEALGKIQNELFIVGADLASPLDRKSTRLNSSHLGISY